MSNKCDKIRELLSPYLDGELGPEERELVENHLIDCEACQQEFAKLKELDQVISQIKVKEPSHEFHPRLIHALSKEYAKKRKRRSLLIQLAPLAAAASILLIVLATSHIFFYKYPKETFRHRTLEKGIETISGLSSEEISRAKQPVTTERKDLKEHGGFAAGKAAREEIDRTKGYVGIVPKKETAEKFAEPAEKPGVATKPFVAPKAAKRGEISSAEAPPVAKKAEDELTKNKVEVEKFGFEDKNKAAAGAVEAKVTAGQRQMIVQRKFDQNTRPRMTMTRNEFELDVSSTDQVAQQIPEDQRVGILVDLDSAGNVLEAQLIKPTGSDTVDSTVIQNVRNQNFRTLTEGIKKFPAREEIYYRFRQGGE